MYWRSNFFVSWQCIISRNSYFSWIISSSRSSINNDDSEIRTYLTKNSKMRDAIFMNETLRLNRLILNDHSRNFWFNDLMWNMIISNLEFECFVIDISDWSSWIDVFDTQESTLSLINKVLRVDISCVLLNTRSVTWYVCAQVMWFINNLRMISCFSMILFTLTSSTFSDVVESNILESSISI